MSKPLHVGFICSGNICRSPYAEARFRQLIKENGWEDRITTSSAGTLGIVDHAAHENTLRLASEVGIDLSTFRSQAVSERYLEGCDVILGLAKNHLRSMRHEYPEARERTWLLTRYPERESDSNGEEPGDVPDPIGQDEPAFRLAHLQIDVALERLLTALQPLLTPDAE